MNNLNISAVIIWHYHFTAFDQDILTRFATEICELLGFDNTIIMIGKFYNSNMESESLV